MLDLQLPSIYEPLFNRDVRILEHAPIDCRAKEAGHALAISFAETGKLVAIIGADQALLDQWTHGQFKKTKLGKHIRYGVKSGELWSIDTTGSSPSQRFDSIVIIDAHSFVENPAKGLRKSHHCRDVIVAEKADNSHWSQMVEGERLKVDSSSATSIWPELEDQGLKQSDPYYERKMMLLDVEPNFESSSFSVFAKNRIKIRTDKPISLLTKSQQESANRQFGTPIVPFERTKLQQRYLARKRLALKEGKKPWFILVKYRRGGFTTIEQGTSYQIAVQRPNSQCVTLADTQAKAARIFRMVSIMADHDTEAPTMIGDSKSALEWDNGSMFFIGTAGSKSFARGDTIQRAHGSEAAFWCPGPHQIDLVNDIKAGVIGAASNGEIVWESTPNRRNWFYQDYIDAKNGESEFTPIFIRWFDDPLNTNLPGTFSPEEILDTITNEESDLTRKHSLSLGQIAFRRSARVTYKHLFPQEFPEDDETCFLTSGQCFFDIQNLLSQIQRLGDEEHGTTKHLPGGYEVVWRTPVPGRRYVAGCDTSEGLQGCDKNGVGILDFETGEQVAAIHGRFKPEKLASYAADICTRYNRALLGVERNNHGHAVLLALKNIGYYEPHYLGGPLYWHSDSSQMKDVIREGVRGDVSRAGWITSASTRPIMLDGLQTAIDDGHMTIHDREMLSECTTFTLQHNGKFSADNGCFDDNVIKWSIAWQMRNVKQPTPEILSL